MAGTNGSGSPFLIAGGGIGGSSPPTRSPGRDSGPGVRAGAGIQGARRRHPARAQHLRALDRIGLKDAVLADAWQPTKMEMRDALTATSSPRCRSTEASATVSSSPMRSPPGRHSRRLSARLPGQQPHLAREQRRVDDYEERGDEVIVRLEGGEEARGRALIACDGMWSKIRGKIVGDGAPRVLRPYRLPGVLKREEGAGGSVAPGRDPVGGAAHPFRALPAAPRRAVQIWSPCSTPTAMWRAGTPKARRTSCGSTSPASARRCRGCSSASTPGACGCCATASR